jgi:phospholipid/cholesterol/gamma-HCH transport system substrate-binding protein
LSARRRGREVLSEAGPPIVRTVAIGALGLVVLAVALIVSSTSGTYETTAVFDDVRGLIEGGQVKAGGVTVGTVEDIAFGDDGLPHVKMRISDDFQLRQGGFANIELASNVGGINRYVELTQGRGPELPDGATLGPSHTDQPVDLDLALSDLDPRTRRDAGKILAAVDRVTRGRGSYVARTLKRSGAALGQTADVLAEVNSDRLALQTLVADGRAVVGALAEDPGRLSDTADHVAGVLATAARRQAELAQATQAIGPGLHQGREVLAHIDASIPDLRALLTSARPAVAQLAPTARVLVPAFDALQPLLDQARGLIDEAPAELRALRPALTAVERLLPTLGPILTRFGPFLDQLRARAPEVVDFFTLGGDATADYDANGNMVRSSTVLIQSARHKNEVGPSSDAAGLVKRPFDRTPGALEGDPWRNYWRTFIAGGRPPRSFLRQRGGSP